MSLVEVIISITILSIVVVPTLQAMTTAMTYSAKSRRRQEVTLSGESIMEAFKAYDIDTLKTMFENDGVADGKTFYMVSGDTKPTYSCTEQADGTYVFKIEQLVTDTGKEYTVEMTATPGEDTDIFQMDSMSEADVLVRCDKSWNEGVDTAALEDLKTNKGTEFLEYLNSKASTTEHPDDTAVDAEGNPFTMDSVSENNIVLSSRTLTFTINSDSITADITYEYYVAGVEYYTPIHPPAEVDAYTGEKVDSGDLQSGTKQELERYPESGYLSISKASATETVSDAAYDSVYLCYYPDYELASGDTIKLQNNTGREITCFLLKQRSDSASAAWTTSHESSYNVSVGQDGSSIKLYHNLNQNIGNQQKNSKYEIAASFTNGSDYKGESIATILKSSGEVESTPPKSLFQEKTLTYNLTLKITDSNNLEVVNMTSTMNEK